MRKTQRHHLILAAMVSAGIAAVTAGSGTFAAGGDPAAKAEVIAAFKRLSTLSGFRIKFTGHDSTGIAEVAPPDKMHSTVHASRGTIESITVGKESRIRYAMPGLPAGWQCLASASRPIVLFDVDKMRKGMTEVVRKPDTVIEGTPVRAYVDPSNPGDILYVGAKTGLPRRFVDADKESGGTGDFYDYGARITVTLPPCK